MFTKHSKNADGAWKDFVHELKIYLQEWIKGLEVETFELLCDLIINDQMKRRVPTEIKEHFIDEWPKFKFPELLSEKLDQYGSVQDMMKKKTDFHDHKGKYSSFKEKNSAHVRGVTEEPKQGNFEKYKSSKTEDSFDRKKKVKC
ncbi:hypothetical protein AVEN_147412-1 [Araneus ventricosus]|uniref:SCAN box domain-containing protein n=1 Tax=Araneus ventricosus TaxID=182803 RepID=A0A4Y2DRP9_ARAVE|nr:hypothetical protein AVEN_147412-1 [Araneus ventricosus]